GTRAAAILVQPQAMHTRFQPSWVLVRTLDRAVTGVKRIASDREPCDARHDDDDSAAPLCTQGPGRGGAPASTPAATMSFRGALRSSAPNAGNSRSMKPANRTDASPSRWVNSSYTACCCVVGAKSAPPSDTSDSS